MNPEKRLACGLWSICNWYFQQADSYVTKLNLGRSWWISVCCCLINLKLSFFFFFFFFVARDVEGLLDSLLKLSTCAHSHSFCAFLIYLFRLKNSLDIKVPWCETRKSLKGFVHICRSILWSNGIGKQDANGSLWRFQTREKEKIILEKAWCCSGLQTMSFIAPISNLMPSVSRIPSSRRSSAESILLS